MGQPQFQAAELVGSVVDDRFEILEKLGEGGMGAVFKARQISVDRIVALKILLHDQRGDPISVERFRHEAYLASRLNHPNAIVIHDFGQSADGLLYIAMEFLEGETLKERIERTGSLPIKSALGIASQTLRVLAEAHRMGLIHRDVKPDNIFLTSIEGDPDFVKVLDFGIAKLTAVRDGFDGYQGGLTVKGKIYGTPKYMSPEQIRGKDLDLQSDLYSFGVVLYELLGGQLPFVADTPVDVMMAHLRDPPPSLSALNAEVVAELETVVLRALEKDRRLRYQNGDEFLEAVENFKFNSGFYSVPGRVAARVSDGLQPGAHQPGSQKSPLPQTMMLDSVGPFGDGPDEDDDDATLMGAQLDRPPPDERTVMEFEDEMFEDEGADAHTVFEPEDSIGASLSMPMGLGASEDDATQGSVQFVGDSILQLVDELPGDLLPGAPAVSKASPVAVVPRPLSGKPLSGMPFTGNSLSGRPLSVGPLSARPLSARPLSAKPLSARPLGLRPLVAEPLVTAPIVQDELTMMEFDEVDEAEMSKVVPIPHFDDSLSGIGYSPAAKARQRTLLGGPGTPHVAPPRPASAVPPPKPAARSVQPPPARPAPVRGASVSRPIKRPVVSKPAVAVRAAAQNAAPARLMPPAMGDNAAINSQNAIATQTTHPGMVQPRRSKLPLVIAGVVALLVGAAAVVVFVIKPFDADPGETPVVAVGPPQVDFASDPTGVEIFYDNRFIGETPISHAVKAGSTSHELQLATKSSTFRVSMPALPGASWMYVMLPKKGTPLGHVIVTSTPPGAAVSSGGKAIGQTPLVLIAADKGSIELTLESAGQSKTATAKAMAAGAQVEVAF
ncbi:MAG: serine/threonine protein kinase [Bradymonadia bacterium]|jgi:serine/threonine protein kinase